MKLYKSTKLNKKGFSHHIVLPLIVIALVALIGVRVITSSHADTPIPPGGSDCNSSTYSEGSSGACVSDIQVMVSYYNQNTKPSHYILKITGTYGLKTKLGVSYFQKHSVTGYAESTFTSKGVVNSSTWAALCSPTKAVGTPTQTFLSVMKDACGNDGIYTSYYWMVNDSELGTLINAGLSSTLLNYFFNNSHTLLIIGSDPSVDAQLPDALKVQKYASEAALASAAQKGFPSGISYVAYDGETWSQTPKNEQNCPIDYAAMAETIVHQKNLGFIYTPATDLAPDINNSLGCKAVLGTGTKYSIPGGAIDKYADFLNENFAGLAAPYSDILEIQAQQLQTNSVGFNYFSSNAVDQANAATNSKVPVLIGLTTDDNLQAMTLQELINAYNGTKSYASGYWLNIPNTGTPDPALAVSFLQQVYELQGN